MGYNRVPLYQMRAKFLRLPTGYLLELGLHPDDVCEELLVTLNDAGGAEGLQLHALLDHPIR